MVLMEAFNIIRLNQARRRIRLKSTESVTAWEEAWSEASREATSPCALHGCCPAFPGAARRLHTGRFQPISPRQERPCDFSAKTPESRGGRGRQKTFCILMHTVVYLYKRGRTLRAALSICPGEASKHMKYQRHNVIRELVANSLVSNQDELRRKLRRRGFEVTQATLSRDIHELHIMKGPAGYSLPNNGNGAAEADDDAPPSVAEVLEGFGLRTRQAMNQVIIRTVQSGAQPVAAALDHEEWPEVVGTLAGDDTVLVICQDARRATEVEARLRTILES